MRIRLNAKLVIKLIVATFAMYGASGPTYADEYPNKPVTIVVAYPAGGDTDVLARVFAERMSKRFKQTFIVENRTGAGGTIGTKYVANAKPDGYTLLMSPNTVAISPLILKSQASHYDPENDLTSIAQLGVQPLFVVVSAATGVTSIGELIGAVKTGKIQTYASPGNGTPMQILAEMFNRSAGVHVVQVPYRGSVPAVADMVGGQVPMMFSSLGPVAPYIAQKQLIPLAVAEPIRSPLLPDVPTLRELGFKNTEVGAWQGLMGPKGMPKDLVTRLNAEVNDMLKLPEVADRMKAMSITPTGGEPAALQRVVHDDYKMYTKVVEELGITAD